MTTQRNCAGDGEVPEKDLLAQLDTIPDENRLTPMQIIRKKRAEALTRIVGKGYFSRKRVYVGMATCEMAAGSRETFEVFKTAVAGGLTDVFVSQKGCVGRCNLEPTVEVIEEGKIPVKYCRVTKERAKMIVEKHLRKGEVVTECLVP